MLGRTLAVVTASAVVAGGVAGTVWWFSPYGEVAEVGEVVELHAQVGPDRFDLDLAHEVEVRVPTGVVVLRVGAPVDDLPHGSRTADLGEVDDGDLHAPRGADFVPLQWELEPDPLLSLAVVAGGSRSRIGRRVRPWRSCSTRTTWGRRRSR